MKIFADLHIHSRFSRATSKDISIENLEKGAKLKGLNLIGTGDFTHPLWLNELKRSLKEFNESGLYLYKDKSIFFILQTEVSNIYEQDKKIRKVHNIILAPNFSIAEQINDVLKKYGNLKSDGRPIFNNLTCPELVEILMNISKEIMIIPSHVMTPWYGLFGSKSGFDSVEECFQDQSKHIFALETGLSANPEMLWRISSLDKYTLVSNSDSHSSNIIRLGREFNAFNLEKISYKEVCDAIKSKKNFIFTGEVPPEEGKYHWDGHRNCNVSLDPKEAMKYNNICPVCRKLLTIGVLHRVEELADREEGFVLKNAIPFKTLLPLSELIAIVYNTETYSRKVWEETMKLIKEFGSELNVLLEAPEEKLRLITHEKVVEMILKNRNEKIKMQPGYDGVYGKILLNENISVKLPQKRLDSFTNKSR
ncbi:MAG: endonuclease Q family protein [Candidatus Aenigmatarchaeota archaeon]